MLVPQETSGRLGIEDVVQVGNEGLVQASDIVCVEIVTDQRDGLRCGLVCDSPVLSDIVGALFYAADAGALTASNWPGDR